MKLRRTFSVAALLMALAACSTLLPQADTAPTPAEASRFLQQASFGPSMAEIQALTHSTPRRWLETQFALPQTELQPVIEPYHAALAKGENLSQQLLLDLVWKTAATAPDQLRQRMTLALSEIFVVSFDGSLSPRVRGMAGWYDMLGRNAFGNFRDLLEAVSRSPMMGVYLSHLKNQKEDPSRGRVPDENYAREVMQLFTIGLYELNPPMAARNCVTATPWKPTVTRTSPAWRACSPASPMAARAAVTATSSSRVRTPGGTSCP
ncbi:MAG: hypothetical protein CGU28_00065 [Candidatus Dactylopiibacterium carminicum]|uniref:DUF1800 domain-containing protein n=1 Tax=Candidatus Dactylopiibacterium carminicum TaxID=857335 RepID=A0A272EZ44_9RHOO|nr:DUF1800 family protein [Candidatus Dactylopiibacterium carminicum]KAF7598054.1 DUF1800 domain-containing protein [Candidatus Dactylopiibacterium carminicum]PAS95398.1 MAG: hypothetical protein CGU29_00745 [Candidatus Dactylopiibacterium carminicum]PAS98591.1 MAG: hypothetical protein CGU28_00065 [Candidatus Dactylopiibacterium carminicum]